MEHTIAIISTSILFIVGLLFLIASVLYWNDILYDDTEDE